MRSILLVFLMTILVSPMTRAENPLDDIPEISADEIRLLIVRHAETFHNIDPTMDDTDPKYYAITPRGKKQSAAVGQLLQDQPIHLVLTSLLERTKETL